MGHQLFSIRCLLLACLVGCSSAFQASPVFRTTTFLAQNSRLYQSSFAADGSEYSSKDSSNIDDDDDGPKNYDRSYRDEDDDDSATVELQPVPMSKNSGNRFVAILWDKELDSEGRDALELHNDRIKLTEDHVMFCRKASLYNETFNTDSMVDVVWSLPM
jgi:hypothetical protein